ncbi:MAG: hypothetical protein ACTHMI_12045 [Mucilaginibacter sp.]
MCENGTLAEHSLLPVAAGLTPPSLRPATLSPASGKEGELQFAERDSPRHGFARRSSLPQAVKRVSGSLRKGTHPAIASPGDPLSRRRNVIKVSSKTPSGSNIGRKCRRSPFRAIGTKHRA